MKLTIVAAGRLKAGPEKELLADYQKRLKPAPAGLGPLSITEIEARKGLEGDPLKAAEAALFEAALPAGAARIVLDERGKMLNSPQFAALLEGLRDQGCREAAFVIGGADGHDAAFRDRADHVISLGAMTLPHMLARAVLAEQLYRAATILSGHPYHRA